MRPVQGDYLSDPEAGCQKMNDDMKKLFVLSIALLPLMCMAQDDLYFVGKKAKKATTEQVDLRARTEKVEPSAVVDYHVSRRNDDEYNRRYVGGGSKAYTDSLRTDTATCYDDGYIDDPEADFRCSRRLVRFHSPRFYVTASPYYWDLYYGYGAWDYLYDPYDPWYWDYGWGCGWSWGPWNTWYGGIWGYRPLHAWAYWGWGPNWYGPAVGHPVHRNMVPREYNSSRGQMSSYDRLRTSAARGGLVSTSRTSAYGNSRSDAAGSSRGTGVYSTRRGSYTDYTGVRGSGSAATRNNGRGESYAGTRSNVGNDSYTSRRNNAAARSAERGGEYSAPVRSRSNENSSTRTTTRSTTTYDAPSRSSFGGGGGSFGGGGSRGGGSFGGGGSRGGGGGRR